MRTYRPKGWPKRLADWTGARVRSRREFTSGMNRIPAGTEFVIQRVASGLNLETKACAKCGISTFIRRVDPGGVELLELGKAER